MHRRLLTLLAVVLLVTAGLGPVGPAAATQGGQESASCAFPVSATDATGTEVTVQDEPERVVVVGASATQTMWEVGAREKVVGLWKSPYTTYLDGAADRPNVATQYGYAQVEKVLNQDPDLVLLANVQKNETAQQLRDAGVTVYKFHAATSFQDIYDKTRLIGELVGACEGARATVDWMQNEVQKVKTAMEGVEHESIHYPMGGGYAPGPDSFITDVMRTAGAHNIVLDGNFTGVTAQGVSGEFVVQQDPQWLLATYNPVTSNGTPTGEEALQPVMTDAIGETQAYQEGNVVVVNTNYLAQPAPRVVYPLVEIAKALHPQAWAAVNETTTNATTTASPGTTTASDTTAAPTTTAETTDGSTPGLGLGSGLVALLAAAFLARRR